MKTVNFFGITNEELLDRNKIKVIHGIAGSAKSSNIHKIFNELGVSYQRFTSTHRLKDDAILRYGCHSDTIAGGLFKTVNGKFFFEQKTPDCVNIVIDEILQTNTKVLDWCNANVGTYNIIITTDANQMLTANTGEYFLDRFNSFIAQENVIDVELKKTYRARTKRTEELFYELYNSVNDKSNKFNKLRWLFPNISYWDMPFNANDVFITHTNQIEEYLFLDKKVSSRYDLPLIKKGELARSKTTDFRKYPIVPQSKVSNHTVRYLQPANIGSATRYQGSEVTEKQTLYFLVENHSNVSNREFYTVLSRCFNIDSIVIVTVDLPSNFKLDTYQDVAIKEETLGEIDEDFILEGKTLSELIKSKEGKHLLVTQEQFDILYEAFDKFENVHFNKDFIKCGRAFITTGKGDEVLEERNLTVKYKATIQSLLKKEPQFEFNYLDRLYSILEYHGTDEIRYAHSSYASHVEKKLMGYELDLYSAYPHIFKNERMPIAGTIYETPSPDRINYYMYRYVPFLTEKPLITPGCLVTDDLMNLLKNEDWVQFEFMFSLDYQVGCRMGYDLHDKAHTSVESKQELKELRYGVMQRKYLEDG